MADINTTTHRAPDQIDYASYDDGAKKSGAGKKAVVLPPKGKYRLQTISVDCSLDTRTKDGYLKATITAKVLDPGQAWDEHEIRYINMSTKKYSNREANSMNDYLRACGINANPQRDEDYVALIARTLNGVWEGGVNWEAQHPDSRESLAKDMDAFAVVDGKRLQYMTLQNDPQDRRAWARARITYYASRTAAQ